MALLSNFRMMTYFYDIEDIEQPKNIVTVSFVWKINIFSEELEIVSLLLVYWINIVKHKL